MKRTLFDAEFVSERVQLSEALEQKRGAHRAELVQQLEILLVELAHPPNRVLPSGDGGRHVSGPHCGAV